MNNQRYRVNTPTVTHETIDGEAVIINLDSGNYYSLVDVGSVIWGLLENGASASEVQNLISQTYDGNATDINRGVQELLGQLQQENLILAVDGVVAPDLNRALPCNGSREAVVQPALAAQVFGHAGALITRSYSRRR